MKEMGWEIPYNYVDFMVYNLGLIEQIVLAHMIVSVWENIEFVAW